MDEQRESELQRYLRCQRDLTERLVHSDSLEQVAPGFLAILGELLGWEAGALWEVPDEGSSLRFVCGWSVPELDAEPLWEAEPGAPLRARHRPDRARLGERRGRLDPHASRPAPPIPAARWRWRWGCEPASPFPFPPGPARRRWRSSSSTPRARTPTPTTRSR